MDPKGAIGFPPLSKPTGGFNISYRNKEKPAQCVQLSVAAVVMATQNCFYDKNTFFYFSSKTFFLIT